MSVTTTTNSITTTSLPVLGDYELHHSGSENDSQVANADANSETTLAPQPRRWPSDHRRVPLYRPANRILDVDERPAGINAAEFVFIQVMLHGVWLNASIARLWPHTGGRVNDRIFRYDVGGEW